MSADHLTIAAAVRESAGILLRRMGQLETLSNVTPMRQRWPYWLSTVVGITFASGCGKVANTNDDAAVCNGTNAPDGTECPDNGVCLSGQCSPCSTDAQCGSGRACYTGRCATVTSSCAGVLVVAPLAPSGTYTIATGGTAYRVLCDMETAGGGWTLVMNASRTSRLLVIDQYVTKSLLVTDPAVDTDGKIELLDLVTTGASLAWGHVAGQDTLFVAAPARVAKAPGTTPWTVFNAMDTGFKTFGVGYGGQHSECDSPGGWKIRNLPLNNLDPTKLVMITGSYDGSMQFMNYGVSSTQCFSNLTTWDFSDYSGLASDEIVNVFTR